MAKYTRKRRYYKRKGRWSSNIKTIKNSTVVASEGSFYGQQILCQNPTQDDETVSQKFTVKNIELSYQLEMEPSSAYAVESVVAYIMYVPEGYVITETLPNLHPEWIMAYRFIGSPDVETGTVSNVGRLPPRITTRMARRLSTGDKIILFVTGISSSSNTINLNFNGIVRWWTKAN